MTEPTEKEITAAMQAAGGPVLGGRWAFDGGRSHSMDDARRITRMCLMLDVPVSDVLTARMFSAVVDRVAALERQAGT